MQTAPTSTALARRDIEEHVEHQQLEEESIRFFFVFFFQYLG
jgi:hypothetical protein